MSKLFLVATPIGNLSEISPRFTETINSVNVVLCEDSRVTGSLFAKLDIKKKLVQFNKDNEKEKEDYVLSLLANENIALVSDAGMPAVSDPGARFILAAKKHGHDVIAISGPSALINAWATSGFNLENFMFLGFVSKKETELTNQLSKLEPSVKAIIYFESPNRITKSLQTVNAAFPNADYSISRELTKLYETNYFGKYEEVIDKLVDKGEYVVVVKLNREAKSDIDFVYEEILRLYKTETDLQVVSKMIAYKFNISKNDLYSLIKKVKNET